MKVGHGVKTIALTGVMAALYIVLTLFVNIPLADRISLDLGYAVLGLLVGILLSGTVVKVVRRAEK